MSGRPNIQFDESNRVSNVVYDTEELNTAVAIQTTEETALTDQVALLTEQVALLSTK